MSVASGLRRADDAFGQVLGQVGDEHWRLPTPCERWSVRQLTGHVVSGSAMTSALLAGADRLTAIGLLGDEHLDGDVLAVYREVVRRQADAFDEPGALERTCHHPAGDLTGRELLGLRISDLVVHTWDLASSIGVTAPIDEALAREAWDGLEPVRTFIARVGVYGAGPSGDVADDAPVLDRLLDLSGRRPGRLVA